MKQLITVLCFLFIGVISHAQNQPAKLHATKCLGITKAGQPCKSTIIMKDGYCRMHSPNTLRCGAKTAKGTPCKMPVDSVGQKCKFHKS